MEVEDSVWFWVVYAGIAAVAAVEVVAIAFVVVVLVAHVTPVAIVALVEGLDGRIDGGKSIGRPNWESVFSPFLM